ncbi:uncharacterized protein LAJ45_10519 [Morchella importuna]|uniref:uncharacterized protein n=1 Tax=Morchella importuna TaxID=1174673 RepID=UPI001E8CEC2B|nr:uncharacterized protein LAJ45_10519 [Morchella importuna]KAH8145398.1 hypothetical protein LAJ45_10519 [Morchella importuna]
MQPGQLDWNGLDRATIVYVVEQHTIDKISAITKKASDIRCLNFPPSNGHGSRILSTESTITIPQERNGSNVITINKKRGNKNGANCTAISWFLSATNNYCDLSSSFHFLGSQDTLIKYSIETGREVDTYPTVHEKNGMTSELPGS